MKGFDRFLIAAAPYANATRPFDPVFPAGLSAALTAKAKDQGLL
jgi:hypothetical protein